MNKITQTSNENVYILIDLHLENNCYRLYIHPAMSPAGLCCSMAVMMMMMIALHGRIVMHTFVQKYFLKISSSAKHTHTFIYRNL